MLSIRDWAAHRLTNLLHGNSSDDWSCGGKIPSLETQEPFTTPTGLPWTAKTRFLTTWRHQTRPNYELSLGIKVSLGHGWFKPATTFTLIEFYNNVMMDVMNNKLTQNNIKKDIKTWWSLKNTMSEQLCLSQVWATEASRGAFSARFHI